MIFVAILLVALGAGWLYIDNCKVTEQLRRKTVDEVSALVKVVKLQDREQVLRSALEQIAEADIGYAKFVLRAVYGDGEEES